MEQKPKTVPIRNLRSEEGAEEMVRSENMRLYLGVAEAMLKGSGLEGRHHRCERVALEQRYLWRVLSALEWGFADFDSVNVVKSTKQPQRLPMDIIGVGRAEYAFRKVTT